MNPVEQTKYKDFSDLLPAIFSDLLDRETTKEYHLEIGAIKVQLFNNEHQYAPEVLSHYGALQVVYVVGKIRKFFESVPLSPYCNPVKNENERTMLKKVFRQILSGVEKMEHEIPDSNSLVIKIKKVAFPNSLDVTIKGKRILKEETPENGTTGAAQSDHTALLRSFLSIHKLHDYFGISN